MYNLGKNILFDKIESGQNFLCLYEDSFNHKRIFQNFMQKMPFDAVLFYISHTKNKLKLDQNIQTLFFNVINEEVIHKLQTGLAKSFHEVEKTNKPMLLVADWSGANLNDCELFLPFLNSLIKKSQELNPPGWKRQYPKARQQKFPLTIINAFDTADLADAFISNIMKMHQRIYLLQKQHNTFFLPTISPYFETIFPQHHVLPQEILEKLVKNNLELITLLFLERGAKSGYAILKEIANHFHCVLSQGTLYPLLYRLEKEKSVIKENGNGREVVYSLIQKTKDELKIKKETYLNAYQHLASFFENGGGQLNNSPKTCTKR